jgi:hypothetical protein
MNAIHAMTATAASAIGQCPPEWQGLYSSSSSTLCEGMRRAAGLPGHPITSRSKTRPRGADRAYLPTRCCGCGPWWPCNCPCRSVGTRRELAWSEQWAPRRPCYARRTQPVRATGRERSPASGEPETFSPGTPAALHLRQPLRSRWRPRSPARSPQRDETCGRVPRSSPLRCAAFDAPSVRAGPLPADASMLLVGRNPG